MDETAAAEQTAFRAGFPLTAASLAACAVFLVGAACLCLPAAVGGAVAANGLALAAARATGIPLIG